MKKVVKRDGRKVAFDATRIEQAVIAAMKEAGTLDSVFASELAQNVMEECPDEISVEDIQDRVEKALMDSPYKEVARAYIIYRNKRTKARGAKTAQIIADIIATKKNDITRENANMNADTPAGMMMKFSSESARAYTDDYLISDEAEQLVRDNILHIHDKDYYPTKSLTCIQHPLDKLLNNGFAAGHGESRAAKRIETASILGCISMETVQNRFCSLR